jgi:transcriptional regulator with XRE-family HTH domain
MPRKLPHYLRYERRRIALTQTDVAALLGGAWKQRVAWYERGKIPPIETALAFEIILGKPVAEIFGKTYERIALDVRRRAQSLLRKQGPANTRRREHRKRSLERIAA